MSKLSQSLSSWWSSWRTQPPAKRRRHVSILIGSTLLVFLIIFLIFNNIIILPEGMFTTRTSRLTDSFPVPENTIPPETNPYLTYASAILAHFDPEIKTVTDSRGFYGDSQWCNSQNPQNNLDCQVNLNDLFTDSDPLADHNSIVQLIWARYQYYLATGDPEQLQILLDDLNNLVTNVLDSEVYALQNQNLNCLLMHELALSLYLDDATKTQAARVCIEANPEVHPESAWEYTQYDHPPFFIDDFSGTAIIDDTRVITEEMRTIYDSASLQQTFNQLLQVLGNGGVITPSEYSQRISDTDKNDFLGREAIAALNYLISMEFNRSYPEFYEENFISYLLLTRETLEWVLTNPDLMDNPNSCFVAANLRYYLENLAPDLLTPPQISNISHHFPTFNTSSDLTCLLATDMLLPSIQNEIQPYIVSKLNRFISLQDGLAPEDKTFGFFIASNGGDDGSLEGYIYPVIDNAYQAGLLSKYSKFTSL
jgi:hypothetical protein